MRKLNYAVLAAALLCGCVAAPEIKSTFDANEAAFIHKQGNGSISAQAFLRRNDGVVVYAAGSEVRLIPKTRYSEERITALYRGAKYNVYVPSPPSPPGFESAMKATKADGEGRFSFTGLADGDYYVVTSVKWLAGDVPQGGNLMESVSVRGGNSVNVIMTGT
jgi:hypothetical protein